jgi:DNA polymerase-1
VAADDQDDKRAKRLVVIDGKSVFYRAFYAMSNLRMPRGEDGSEGEPIGGVYGFATMLLEINSRFEPDMWAVAWDKSQTNIRRRREIYADYKANRKKAPDDFYAQLPHLYELFEAFHIPLYEFDDYEADDIMGTFAAKASPELEVDLVSSDLDMLQALHPNVRFYALKTGLSNIEEFDEKAFERKFGVLADQFLDLKALKGDASDNIPGVAGIGPKTAAELLRKYDTLDNIYTALDNGNLGDKLLERARLKLTNGKKNAYISRELGELAVDAPVKINKTTEKEMEAKFDIVKLCEIFQRFGFRSLAAKAACPTAEPPQPLPRARRSSSPSSRVAAGSLSAVASESPSESAAAGSASREVIAEVKDGLLISEDVKKWLHEQDDETAAKTLASFASKKLFPFDLTVANFLLDDTDADFAELQRDFNNNPRIKWVAANLDFPLIPVLYKMEKFGMKIDKERLAAISADFTAEAADLEKQVMKEVGEQFNLNSPKQLSEVLFEKLKLSTDGIRKTQTAYSTGRAELAKLRDLHPVIGLIEKYRVVQKLLSTYADALPKLADENDRIHTTLSQTATSTGRLASSNPNLQNIPTRTDLGRKIRTAFVADKGNVLIEADYSQFELRIAAALSGEKSMIDAFNSGEDAHMRTASEVFNVPVSEVTKAQRSAAKTINFGVLYGMSATGLAEATKMTRAEALQFINRYFATYPKLDAFMKNTLAEAKRTGRAETWLGRRHYFQDLHTPNFSLRQAAERAAMNMPIQGTEADLMKLAMIRLDAKLAEEFPESHLIMQVHDSLLVETPKELAPKITQVMEEIMEGVAPRLPVKLAVDIRTIKNWGE